MSHKFKLNDVKLGDNTDFQMTIGNLEIETSVEVYKILIPFYKDILSMLSNVFKDDKKVPKKTDVERMLDAMGEGAQEWATNYGKKRSEERKKQTAN